MAPKYLGILLYVLSLYFGIYECQMVEITDFVTNPRGGSISAGQVIMIQWRWVTFPVCAPNIVDIQFCPGTQTQGCTRIGSGSFSESSFQWTTTWIAPTGRLRLQLRSVYLGGCRTVTEYSPIFSFCRPLAIDQHPQDASALVGNPVQFWVGATGTHISYQWLFNSEPITGANEPTHTIESAQLANTGSYSVRIIDECQTLVTSRSATLRACPAIVVQSLSPTQAEVGNPFTLSIEATGLNLRFTWSKEGIVLSLTNALNFLNFQAQDFGQYSVRIEDSCGEFIELHVMLASKPFAIIENPPSEVYMFVGDSIRLAVQVLKGDLEVFYQWYRNGSLIPGETEPSLNVNFTLADNGAQYVVSVSVDGLSLRSVPSVISAYPVPEIVSTSIEPAEVFPGQDVTFSVMAIGQRIQYEWLIDGEKRSDMTGLNTIQLQAGLFSVNLTQVVARVSNPNGFEDSDPMQITFKPKPAFIDYTMQEHFLLLNQTITLDMTNQMYGEDLTIRWLRDNDTFGEQNEATLEVQLDPSIVSTLYQLEASNPSGATLGPEIWIHPEPAPEIINSSESPVLYFVDTSPTLFIEAIGQGVQYRWFKGSDLLYFKESSQLQLWLLSDRDDGLVVRGEAFNVNGFSSFVDILLKMEPAPVITQQPPTPFAIFMNETAELSVRVEGRGLTFVWTLEPRIPYTQIDGDGISTIKVPNILVPRVTVTVKATNQAGTVQSNPAFIIVQEAPVFAREHRALAPFKVNSSHIFDRTAIGAGVKYTWVVNNIMVFNETSDAIWILPQITTSYNGTILRVTASNPSGSVTAQTMIIVVTLPELQQPLNSTYDVLIDEPLRIEAVSLGYGVSYEWRHNGVWLKNTTVGLFDIASANPDHNGKYQLYLHNLAGTTGPIQFSIVVIPLTVRSPNGTMVYAFAGDTVSLFVSLASQALSTLTFSWARNDAEILGENSTTLTIHNVSAIHEGKYQIFIRNRVSSAQRDVTNLQLLGAPMLQNLIHNQPTMEVTAGRQAIFLAIATPETRLEYQWYRNGEKIEGETSRRLVFEASYFMNEDKIKVRLTNPVASIFSEEVTLNVRPSDKATALIVVFVCVPVIAAIIVAAIFVRRKINQRRQITFNKATYGTDDVKYQLLPPWTAPDDSKLCNTLENLPVTFSKTTLTFGGTPGYDVGREYTDTIDVKFQGVLRLALSTIRHNKRMSKKRTDLGIPLLDVSKKDRDFLVIFHLPETPKCSLTVMPDELSLNYSMRPSRLSAYDSSGNEDNVQFKLKMNVSTSVTALIGVEMPKIGRHFYIPCHIAANPSVWIDIDEIQMDPAPIGEGGFGVVYKGQYKGQVVAVKMLKHQDWVDKKTMAEFENEIQFLSELRNPGIVSLIGASKLPGKMAIVTEFMHNGSLEKLMAKKIPYGTKLRIALEIAKAIDYLHEHNVLHRDIKSDNVLIESTDINSPNMIRLSDFGSARRISEEKMETFTKGVGTPIYMAPEILQMQRYNKAADIYSYGVLLWVLITQKEPYTAFNHVWDVTKYVTDGNREVIPAGCPADYARLITDCWCPEPEERLPLKAIIKRLETMYEKEFKM